MQGLSFNTAARPLAGFLGWWTERLREAWQDWQRSRTVRRGGALRAIPRDGELILEEITRSGTRRRASAAWTSTAGEFAMALGKLLAAPPARCSQIEVELPEGAVLRRRIHLPAAAGRQLRRVVELQVERLMPLAAEAAVFACRIVGGDENGNRILVEIVQARRNVVEAVADATAAIGAQRTVVLAASTSPAIPAAVLLERDQRREHTRVYKLALRFSISAASLLLLLAASVLVRYHLGTRALEADVQGLKAQAGVAERERDRLSQRVERIGFLSARMSSPDASEVLAELTRLLPADAWVFQFQIEDQAVQLAGYAKDASALSAALARSPLFAEVSLRSAIRGAGNDGERFDISLRVKPRPSP